eukprot:TRINITY_DN30959_c0_g1_i1.p1 TRINITY_DN30959_c0_g1~~TRINITY_DN30959_c0_g1_i1.p1  ORF type:complete len:386 (-),score=42.85 TRINITY_DN30959_c0_g1_i1:295-1323(-)
MRSSVKRVAGFELNTRNEACIDNIHMITCPYLSTLVNEGELPLRDEYTRDELQDIMIASGMRLEDVRRASAANFDNNPTNKQDIFNMEGAQNEHATSTGISDCATAFRHCKMVYGFPVCKTETPNPNCGLPNTDAFNNFVSSIDVNQDDFITPQEMQDAEDNGAYPVIDTNPFGKGTIFGATSALLSLFGQHDESGIWVSDLRRVMIDRRFPRNGYWFGRKPGTPDFFGRFYPFLGRCVPGTSIPSRDRCNLCKCPKSGKVRHAKACTRKACPWPRPDRCPPFTKLFAADGCNTCRCPLSGRLSKLILCTRRKCGKQQEEDDDDYDYHYYYYYFARRLEMIV